MTTKPFRIFLCVLAALLLACKSGPTPSEDDRAETGYSYAFAEIDGYIWTPGDHVPVDWTMRTGEGSPRSYPAPPALGGIPNVAQHSSGYIRLVVEGYSLGSTKWRLCPVCDIDRALQSQRCAIVSVHYRGPTFDRYLEDLYRFPRLRKVDFSKGHSLSPSTLRYVCRSGSIRWVVLPRACDGKADALLAALLPMRELEALWLPSEAHSVAGLEQVARFTRLTALRIQGSAFLNDRVAAAIARLPALEYLRIDGAHLISEHGLQELLAMPSLQRLALGEPVNISDEALHAATKGATATLFVEPEFARATLQSSPNYFEQIKSHGDLAELVPWTELPAHGDAPEGMQGWELLKTDEWEIWVPRKHFVSEGNAPRAGGLSLEYFPPGGLPGNIFDY